MADLGGSITPASKHVKGCHAGLDPASTPVMDSRFRGKDRIGIYCCRSNNFDFSVSFTGEFVCQGTLIFL